MTIPRPPVQPGDDPLRRRIRTTWRLLFGSFAVLGVLLVALLLGGRPRLIDVLIAGLVVVVGYAAILHRNAFLALEARRRGEVESFARILRGLSRSISPDAIVDAIVEDLGKATGADHVVVVRQRADANALEATLVSTRPGVPSSTTLLPRSDLDDPGADADEELPELVAVPVGGDAVAAAPATPMTPAAAAAGSVGAPSGASTATVPVRAAWSAGRRALVAGGEAVATLIGLGASTADDGARRDGPGDGEPGRDLDPAASDRVAERIAARVRSVYGLRNTLAAPLRTEAGVIGAIVLSRRRTEPWPASARTLLAAAGDEASAALARAFSHRDAETRASTDALTGLPNRRYFDEFCGLLARRRRAEDAVGVMMVDIDRFKGLNDTHGHAVGDAVLRAVGGAIARAVRDDDVPARYGGEEFAVLLRNPTPAMAVEIGERVRGAVGALDLRRHGVPGVTVSVGVAVGTRPDQPIAELIEDADAALYEAKRRGRDRVVAA